MGAPFDGIGLEMTVHAEAFTGGTEECQEHDGEGVDEQQPVASLGAGDVQGSEARSGDPWYHGSWTR